MIKTARQLKDLIRNLSREKSADAQLLMRNYMMERFLERISLSEYRDKFILKGGMLVAAMVGLDARSTMDLDATVKGANVNVEDIENLISAIVSVPIDDGVKFQLKSISEIMDEAEYPGIRVSMTTTFDGVVTPLKIDISTGDAITPREVRYSFKLMLENRSIDIWAYNLETVLAEKLETIITRTTTNTRMRDFYDIYDFLPALRSLCSGPSYNSQGIRQYKVDAVLGPVPVGCGLGCYFCGLSCWTFAVRYEYDVWKSASFSGHFISGRIWTLDFEKRIGDPKLISCEFPVRKEF